MHTLLQQRFASIQLVMDTLQASAGSHFEPRLLEHFMRILPQILDIQETWRQREIDAGL